MNENKICPQCGADGCEFGKLYIPFSEISDYHTCLYACPICRNIYHGGLDADNKQ